MTIFSTLVESKPQGLSGTLSEGFFILSNMENLKEEWKPIVGYEGYYEVSNMGRVRGLDRTRKSKHGVVIPIQGRILAYHTNTEGYRERRLNKDGKESNFRIHRLVAEAFIPNPDNKPFINHIDFDRTNNCVDNLEWCTPKENAQHSRHRMYNPVTGNFGSDHPLSKSVDVYEVCIRKIGEFGSYIEAAAEINKPCSFVSLSLREPRIRIKDFVFIQDDKLKSNIGDVFVWTDVLDHITKE